MSILSSSMQEVLAEVVRSTKRSPAYAYSYNTLTVAALISRGAVDIVVRSGDVVLVPTDAGRALARWQRNAELLSWADARKVAKRK